VGHVDHRRVADDVLNDLRLQSDLRDGAGEGIGRVRVHSERNGLTGLDLTDVRFVYARLDLHLCQVFRDYEQRGRRHACRHRLANVDVARDDDAIDWSGDDGVTEVDLVLIQRGARLDDLRLGALQ